ncbi:TPA: CshA/CshB family fibrillar adhesin-related protein, partial [Streptococcus suis]
MNKNRKGFDWYASRQRFSIRKFHFGAASILLGLSLAMTAGQEVSANTTESEDLGNLVSEVVDVNETESISSNQREVVISYVVDYVDESGQIISHQVYQHEQETAEASATAVITMTAQVPEGYILSEGQSSSLLQTISEGAENRICFKVRQSTAEAELIDDFEAIPQDENPINSTGVEKEKIAETELLEEDSVEAVTPELDQGVPKEATVEKEQASPTIASGNLVLTVNELPPLPTDLPAAKEVFEQVASEATVLASEGERLIASKETNNDKLKTAVAETKQVVAQVQEDLIASLESLERMHQQITAIREKVNLLAVELRKISPDGEIRVLLSSTSNIASGANNEATDGSDATFFTGPQHYRNYDEADLNKIKRQITWLDFGDRTAWTGLDMIGSNPALRVGARYRKEISPGYIVEITITELKPFESTDVYRDRVKGTDMEWTYNPNAVNSNMKTYANGKTDYGNTARIIAADQDSYSNAKVQGFDVPGKVTLRSNENGGNVGVKFTTKATYLGNVVPLNMVFMSGEEAGNSEFETYVTNGDPFELFGELSNTNTVSSYKVIDNWLDYNDQVSGHSADWKAMYDSRYWANIATEASLKTAIQSGLYRNDETTKVVDGIGTRVFGPVSNHKDSHFSTPIIMTKNASEVGMYIMSSGRQSAMIGVALLDYGDAPDTYGTGAHAISLNQADKQPYLGSLPADIDFIPEGIPVGSAPWYRDELINQFDEGPSQLMGDRVESGINYTLHHSNDGAYALDFKANTNTHAKAYVQGWVDFNNDGRFDETENSGLIEIVSGKTDYKLHFRDIYQNVDPTVTRLGVRMRIALDAVDITTPYLTAYSGEVEDFQIQMTHPPRGSRVETSGNQGVTQNATVEFQAFGENRYSKTLARIDTTVEPQLVKDDGSLVRAEELDAQGYYVIPGEGKYKVTSIGSSVNVEFVPEADFITEYSDGTPVRQAKGISIRRTSTVTDDQGVAYTTGWHAITSLHGLENTSENVTVNGLAGTMDGRYIPHVVAVNPTGKNATSKDIQGAVQQGRPTFISGVTSGGAPIPMGYEVDSGGQAITENTNPKYPLKLVAEDGSEVGTTDAFAVIDGVKTNVGTYSINGRTGEVTYTPNAAGKKYIGTVEAATVIARDVNGATAMATYTPTITPVSPTAEAATSVGLQGKEQKGIPVFKKSVTAPDGVADLVDTSLTLLDSDGNKVSSLIVDNQGTYTLNSDGSITFVPLPDFVGPAIPVKVQKTDTNGSSVTTTYTPVVVEVKPAGDPDESFGLKGQSQTSTTEFFEPGKIDLNGDRAYDPVSEIVPLDKSSIKLLDSSNAPVNEVSIDNQGTYRLNNDGSVTFTPLADFVGTATPIRVQMKDVNGTAVTTTYTPTVVEVPESELTETVTRTIHYVKADGSIASPSVTKTLEYTRTVDIDSQTGKISYGEWTSTDDDFPEVISPTIPNLGPDVPVVAARENVPGDAADETITVIYSGVEEQLATITYKILTGNSEVEVAKDGVQGQSGLLIHYSTEQRITAFEELGYELVSDGFTTAIDKNFDDDASIQNFDVILRPKIRTLIPNDPTNPVTPGQPVDPNDPTSPVLDKLIETVTRTVKYLDETNREVAVSPAPTNASFTRTATYNHVTKTISYSEWNSTDPVIEGNPLPVVTGYIATSASANGQAILPTAVEKDQTVRYNSDDVEEIVIYSQLGSWTPKVPEGFDPVPPIVYPNDPNDPTRPGEEIPTIPYIPGLVPKGPDGSLPPVNPEDPSKGYKVPPVPFDPTNDTPISYIKDTQKAEIVFVNVTNPNQPVILDRVALTGETGAEIGYDPTTKLAELTSAGYLVTKQPDYSPSQIYSRDSADTERFVYELIERIVPIDPSNPPIPGKPVDPTNPDGPKWPDAVKELVTSETVTRTITYVDKAGNQVFDTVTESKDFTRTAKVNLVTGEIEYGPWSASQELPAVPSPYKEQYIVDVKEVGARTVQATDEDLEVVVTYTPLGSWVTIVPPGTTPINPIIYPNHPTDPTQPGSETPILPHIPSSSPLTPDIDHPGVFKPLLPVDPNDVTKGYHAPSVPTNPTKDTLIVYGTPGSQFATVTIKEQDSGNVLDVLFGQGKANEPVAISTDNKIELLKKAGYELVSDAYNDSPKLFDTDDSSIQNWDIVVRPKVVTVTPDNPQTPGNPVDPENPDGPKWPDGLKESDLNKTVTRTILYKYEDDSPVLADDGSPKVVRQTVSFYRTATVDLVNASVTYGEWSESQMVPAVDSPVISGYITDTSAVTALTVSANDSDQTVTVVYKKLGSWVPNIPGQPVTPIPYPNHPTDPTKPGDGVPTLPHVPGFIPVGPDGVTPLPPVDPDDPSKGYELPPIPTDPGVDTPITYVPEAPKSSTVTVKYVDESGKELIPSTKLEGKVGDSYTSEGKVIEGYLLKEIPTNATGTMVEGGTVVTYVYVPIGSWVPNIPGQPVTPIPYPNHPTDPTKPGDEVPTLPHVPGFIPVGPDGVTPLPPVDPDDPSKGYELPPIPTDPGVDTPITYVPEAPKSSTVTVKYVDESGKELIPSTKLEGKVGDSYTSEGKVIEGYLLKEIPSNATGTMVEGGTVVTYVYVPIGSWVPNIPGQPVTPIPYPNHPTDPTKPGDEVPTLPHVPGFIPVGPDGVTPLPPVDPDDPSKGYELPPIPTDPGVDTPITYVPEAPKSSTVTVKYVDESGKDLLPPVVTEG